MSKQKFLEFKNLQVEYVTKDETVHAVNDVSFSVERGKTLGLVGETGAGKTSIARAILRVLPMPPAEVQNGQVFLRGRPLANFRERAKKTLLICLSYTI